MTAYLSVRNFERFQHYKDRNPVWIKLYNDVLDDYEFGRLPDASKAHLLAIWLLASRYDNRIPFDAEWVGRRINATSTVDLAGLVRGGFLISDQDCSNLLAEPEQVAIPERETEGEREKKEEDANASLSAAPTLSLVPAGTDDLQPAFDAYNLTAERCGLSRAQKFDNTRKSKLRQRLKECGGLSGWVAALEKLEASSFCRGVNDQGWRADFDFLMQAKSFTRLMEGRYDDRKSSGAAQRQQKPTHDSAQSAARSGILEGLGLAGELECLDGSAGPHY